MTVHFAASVVSVTNNVCSDGISWSHVSVESQFAIITPLLSRYGGVVGK